MAAQTNDLVTMKLTPATEGLPKVVCLDMSTAHVTYESIQWLISPAADKDLPISIAPCTYSVFATVPPTKEEIDALPINDDIKQVMAFARANGCDIISLDQAGAIITSLPVYEWEGLDMVEDESCEPAMV